MLQATDFTVLRTGIDSLEVAFQGALGPFGLAMLEEAKQASKASGEPEVVDLNGFEGLIRGYGSNAKAGYAYILSTGPLGEVWMFKRSEDPQQWNIRVDVKAAQLAIDGYTVVKDRLYSSLHQMGATVITESVGRLDVCVDIVANDFVLDPGLFVSHSRMHTERNYEPIESMDLSVVGSRRLTAFTIGRMPGRQLQVYDKSLEVKSKPTSRHWYKIWGVEPDDCPMIWRVELRFGKVCLSENWNIKTFEQLEIAAPQLIEDFLTSLRYVKAINQTNVTRSELHPFWSLVQKALSGDMGGIGQGVEGKEAVKGKVIEGQRHQLLQMYWSQIKGLLGAFMVLKDIPENRVLEDGAEALFDAVNEMAGDEWERLKKTMERARKKIHILDADAEE
ncbi:MAG: hypothetical protein HQL69_20485 [Magnetococcales bacterium]|nr:hypothetical protein [Magnetococcales bacterium]